MADQQSREQERRWKSGDPAARLPLLVESVRAGESVEWASYQVLAGKAPAVAVEYLQRRRRAKSLGPLHLDLAAYCGHRPAAIALGTSPGDEAGPGAVAWLRGLAQDRGWMVTVALLKVFLLCSRGAPHELVGDASEVRVAFDRGVPDENVEQSLSEDELEWIISIVQAAYRRRRERPYLELIKDGLIEWALSEARPSPG